MHAKSGDIAPWKLQIISEWKKLISVLQHSSSSIALNFYIFNHFITTRWETLCFLASFCNRNVLFWARLHLRNRCRTRIRVTHHQSAHGEQHAEEGLQSTRAVLSATLTLTKTEMLTDLTTNMNHVRSALQCYSMASCLGLWCICGDSLAFIIHHHTKIKTGLRQTPVAHHYFILKSKCKYITEAHM